jgi:hypothetical protein
MAPAPPRFEASGPGAGGLHPSPLPLSPPVLFLSCITVFSSCRLYHRARGLLSSPIHLPPHAPPYHLLPLSFPTAVLPATTLWPFLDVVCSGAAVTSGSLVALHE